jgi:hypothetical protein
LLQKEYYHLIDHYRELIKRMRENPDLLWHIDPVIEAQFEDH